MKNISFDDEYIYLKNGDRTMRQSLLWYPALRKASKEVRESYILSQVGIHWRGLDVDISYESFSYSDAEPKKWQRFFLSDPSIDYAQYAQKIGIAANKFYRYIYGIETPNAEEERLLESKL